jgi:polyhydroxybutyrate depolymerase
VKALLKAIIVSLIGLVILTKVFAQKPLRQSEDESTSNHSISFGGLQRTYVLHVPQKYVPKTKVAVVIVLHGSGGSARNMLQQGKWVEKSDKEGFIVVGLDGTLKNPARRPNLPMNPRGWNDGGLGLSKPDHRRDVDDVGFINAAIDQLLATKMADPRRIYVTGFSNGAGMTFRVGAELSERIAAIAPVSNGLLVSPSSLKFPVSLILIWGTADPINPIKGGTVKRFGENLSRPSAENSWKKWGSLLNCPPTPKTIFKQKLVEGKALAPCIAGSEAIFYRVDGMGHNWPSGGAPLPAIIVGKQSNAIDATDLIWSFFAKHKRV